MPFFPKKRSRLIWLLGMLALSFFYLQKKQAPLPAFPEGSFEPSASIDAPIPSLQVSSLPARSIAAPDLPPGSPPASILLNDKGLSHFNEGRYQEALSFFSRALELNPSDEVLQKNAAQAHAQMGWGAVRENQFAEAISHFEAAIRFFDRESSYHLGQAVSLYRTQKEDAAVQSLRTVLALNPNEAAAHKMLGEIAYGQNAFEKAADAWEKALRLDPADRALSARLEKIKGESALFSTFQSERTGRFSLLFDGRERREEGRRVLHLLEEAHREVGQALFYYPEKPIFAVLYSDQQFRDVTRSPAWTKGLFDGRIHLPVGGTIQNEALLRKIVYHEYTHALVHQLSHGKTPTWLNEGLALYFEGENQGPHRPALPLIPLERLHGSFMNYDEATARQAYEESRSATGYLVERYGLFRMKLLLEKLATASSFPQVFEEIFMIRYADFQLEWQKKIVQES